MVNYIRRCLRAFGKKSFESQLPEGHSAVNDENDKILKRIDDDIFSGVFYFLLKFFVINFIFILGCRRFVQFYGHPLRAECHIRKEDGNMRIRKHHSKSIHRDPQIPT